MPTVIEKIKQVVLVNYDFEQNESFKIKMFSSDVSDYQDTDAREKADVFVVENSSTAAVFLVEILMAEFELVVAQNLTF